MVNHGNSNKDVLAIAAPVFTVVSAIASLFFMSMAGQRQQSIFLIMAFTLWVLGPFAGLLLANRTSMNWSAPRRTFLHSFMIIMALASIIVYALGLKPGSAKPAFTFLVFPFLSWAIMIGLLLISRRASDKL